MKIDVKNVQVTPFFNIIGFAGIGIGLISVFGSLRISIADGYLNGILFFSNVITLFSPVFSVQSETLKSLLRLFSWLNLNIGFEYCFYEGMTALQQSTLSFVFPVYLYILIGLIILLSKYSQKFARSFNSKGYSATKLFATLFVMTYTTILSNSINILGYSIVYTLDGVNRTVWITDPNQPYFEGFHAVLCCLCNPHDTSVPYSSSSNSCRSWPGPTYSHLEELQTPLRRFLGAF